MEPTSLAGETLRPLFAALALAQIRARRWKAERATHADLALKARMLLARVGLSFVVARSSFERSTGLDARAATLLRAYHLVHDDGSRIELALAWPLRSLDEDHVAWVVDAMTAHLVCDLLVVDAAKHHAPPPLEDFEALAPTAPHVPALDGRAPHGNARNGAGRGGA